jgi:ABC-type transporter Mla subunit MlaD
MSTSSTAELDQTISTLQEGLTSVPPATALSLIDSFGQQVQDLGKSEIASNLSALKQLLTSGSATGPDIGQVLVQLGSQTTSTASGADASISNKLQHLGQLLTEAGNSLLGSTQTSEASNQGSFSSDI